MIVLRNQVESYVRSAEEIGVEIGLAHEKAMICRDVEELASNVVGTFQDINGNVIRWQNEIASAVDETNRERLIRLEDNWGQLYRTLASVFDKAGGFIACMERWGYQVDGKQKFQAAHHEIQNMVCFSLEQVQRAVQQMRQGRGTPLAQVIDELWDAPVR